ncbi:MAG: molybdopterin-dependent oxidoreductase [Leptospiraceae bacterium]|nr:molybdopterin-dependent oxidoreductase [Leptospiraceae bacterium]MCP5494186.1 molybdopterin-dependent oxidoreductase [Leptospiraceae bacterium]
MNTNSQGSKYVFRSCNLCEAICGLSFEVSDTEILSIRGDKNDPLSMGHICPKGPELKNIYLDKDRLRKPLKRTNTGWQEISYEEAFVEVTQSIHSIQSKYGNDSVAVYQGNPTVHNYGSMLFGSRFVKKLKTKNLFSATSVDQLPHHFVGHFMFGSHFLIPVPDIDRTNYFLVLGANPIASNGSMMTSPHITKRLKAIQERKGKLVVVDPRRTETAELANEHHFIKPDTDVFFLLSILNIVFQKGIKIPKHLSESLVGVEEVAALVSSYSPEKTASITGIATEVTQKIAIDFMEASGAVCYGRMGLSTQSFGAFCQWLIVLVNLFTGNLDSQGGSMFTKPAIDLISMSKNEGGFARYFSKARNLPEFYGEFPVAALADEMLYTGEGGIKALVTSCGNPILSTPNGTKLEKAIGTLEFMVSIDYYINETTCHANIILPPTSSIEHENIDMVFPLLAVRNYAKFSPAVFEADPGLKHDWQIFGELTNHLEATRTGKPVKKLSEKLTPEAMADSLFKTGPYKLSIEELKKHPHGIDLGELQSCLPDRLATENKKIVVIPEPFAKGQVLLMKAFQEFTQQNEHDYLLIGRRHLRSNNSWMHNSERLAGNKDRCTLLIHTNDAKNLQIEAGQIVKVQSEHGEISIVVEVTDGIAPGVVSIPHGYGHNRSGIQLEIATKRPGVSINDLTNETRTDFLCHNAAFSGTKVRIVK